jgi:hypothetical protein
MPLNGDFLYLLAQALMGKPGMIQIGPYQHQFQVVDGVDVIADDASCAFGVDDKIQLELFMIMQGEGELFFYAGKNGKAVILSERRDFPYNICAHIWQVVKVEKKPSDYHKDEIKKYKLNERRCFF